MVPWAHRRQSPKRHLDRFSRFCVYSTAKAPNAFQWGAQPQNFPFPLGDLGPHLICGSLDPLKSALHIRHLDRFSRLYYARLPNVTSSTQTETDRQTYHATSSVAIGRITSYRCDTA